MTTLLIMAAGIGSRFGGGIKQLEPVGLHDEIIMDYSVHDAILAGFDKIIFVIRKDIEEDFRERIGNRIEKICEERGVSVAYAFQSLENIPGELPEGRTKPWGTGQAVLAARDLIDGPFAVLNADDFYGKTAFSAMHDWLEKEHADNALAMAGFVMKNTLSDNGGVTRGVCKVSAEQGELLDIVETRHIVKTADPVTGAIGAEADGVKLDPEAYVSMNFWGFPGNPPAYLRLLEEGFREFFAKDVPNDPLKAEYLLPTHIGSLLRENKVTVSVLETRDSWFGVTYKEDKPFVVGSIRKLIESGFYAEDLYSDLR